MPGCNWSERTEQGSLVWQFNGSAAYAPRKKGREQVYLLWKGLGMCVANEDVSMFSLDLCLVLRSWFLEKSTRDADSKSRETIRRHLISTYLEHISKDKTYMRTSELTGIFHETPNLTRNDPEDAKCRKFSAGLLKTQFQICPPSPYETFYLANPAI
ncbi:hypothetical protein Pdw03_5293 [Penicillium digitatum]|uniref:Uncharacterized protein n=1 Tax=Penicillium digitatum TaxID=36651 RepID=A0A7T6XUL3_PENDI|nr:hypothetical protein Pdw03_5293 [Penicillium digitatum]